MPTETEIFAKLSTLIETKINKRNKEAINLPKNEKLIDYFDREIDALLEIEQYFFSIKSLYQQKNDVNKKKAFLQGRAAGLLEAKTGRNHSEYFI